ncbi:MAG: preprotein translocase subunit SecE [Chromatiales bacterium]|jgi:preprotein translocase subunit SecE|nr:preprotein translocase subunit SecE [Chromatiales bacterium]MDH3933186.1 preprotein translocase subunit SecE [Chromatiales bacterium]MDH4014570.1 preprotein translocase subunit SecE [Chromatiales bacterium]PLX57804.1 MAG: preprotein translocase subunit SecE [Chromatiales bacterium]
MNANTETGSGAVDKLLLLTAIALVLGGIVVFYAYPAWSVLLRALIVVGATGAAIAVAMRSQPGQALWRFIVTSRTEVRKMVWPNRQETLTTTGAVLLFVLIMGVFFWGLDFFLLWATRLLTGQGG